MADVCEVQSCAHYIYVEGKEVYLDVEHLVLKRESACVMFGLHQTTIAAKVLGFQRTVCIVCMILFHLVCFIYLQISKGYGYFYAENKSCNGRNIQIIGFSKGRSF